MSKSSSAITKAIAFRLYQVLGQLKGLAAEPRHIYTLVLIRKKLQPLAEALEEMAKAPERIKQFEQRRQDNCKTRALKDPVGNPMIENNNYVIDPSLREAFERELKVLQSEFQADILAYQTQIQKVEAFGEEPVDIELPTIPVSAISLNLTVEQMEGLFPILVDDCVPGS